MRTSPCGAVGQSPGARKGAHDSEAQSPAQRHSCLVTDEDEGRYDRIEAHGCRQLQALLTESAPGAFPAVRRMCDEVPVRHMLAAARICWANPTSSQHFSEVVAGWRCAARGCVKHAARVPA